MKPKDEQHELSQKIILSLEKLFQVQRSMLWDVAKKENLSPIQILFLIYLNKNEKEKRKISILLRNLISQRQLSVMLFRPLRKKS